VSSGKPSAPAETASCLSSTTITVTVAYPTGSASVPAGPKPSGTGAYPVGPAPYPSGKPSGAAPYPIPHGTGAVPSVPAGTAGYPTSTG
jgi:hypothetical protein